MSTRKKSYEDYDEPVPQPVMEGADVEAAPVTAPAAEPETVTPKEPIAPTCTINELMVGWWKLVKDLTPSVDTVGDLFVVYAAEHGWALVDATTVPPPP